MVRGILKKNQEWWLLISYTCHDVNSSLNPLTLFTTGREFVIMTSVTDCSCGTEVILYENPNYVKYGRRWMLFCGICTNCGRHIKIEPTGELAEIMENKFDEEPL